MGHRRLIFWRVTLLTALASLATGAASNPQDGEVVRGSATITATSPGRLDILQTSDKAVIDWREFSIGAAEHTHFQQPDRQAVALNRVSGYQRSEIYGKLSANGRLFLINPKGILFGQSAQVDVAGLVATTSNISNDDFMSERLHFNAPTTTSATVENQGNINIAEGGLAALVAPGVTNSGIIQARLGKVLLASGNRFTLDLYGDRLVEFAVNDQVVDDQSLRVANSGEVYADGGSVLLTANTAKGILDQAINMDGYIQARSAEFDNGEIVLSGGEGGQVRVAGSLVASGREAGQTGGYIKVKGAETIISGSTRVDVSGANGGGIAELSGQQLDLDAGVNLNGGTGPGGILTLDPITLTVDNGMAIALVDTLNTGGTVNVAAEKTIHVNAEIDSSAQSSTASLNFKDQDTDNALTINLNADIKLGANQVLSGEGTAVNVADTAQIQDGVDVAAGSATVTVAARTYAGNVTLDKQGLTLTGSEGALLSLERNQTGFNITADDVTLSGMEIEGPFDSHFTRVDWDNEGNSFGVTVAPGVTGASILNNTIRNTRSGVSFFAGSEATASGNSIDNTKGSFLVRSDDIILNNNAVGANGNEWDIVFLNGVSDAAYSISPRTDQKLYGADIMALSQSNGGMRVLDRRYGSNGLLASTPQFGNRSHIEVSANSSFTAADDFNLGNGLGNLRQPLSSINAAIDGVVDGGYVDLRAGSYVENVVIDKAVTLTGAGSAGSSATILAAAGGNSMQIAASIGADATVAVSGIGFDGVNGAQSGFYLAPNAVLGELIVTDTRYQNHQENGFRVIGKATGGSGLAQLTMKDAVFLNNGRIEGSQGVGDLLLYYFNGNADLSDIDISNDGSVGARYGIQMRGLEANGSFGAGGFAAMGKVTLDNVAVSGNYAASHLGIQGFDGLDNLSLNDVSLGGGNSHTGFGGSLFLSNVAEHSHTRLDLGNTDFLGSKTLIEGPGGLQTEEDLTKWDMLAGVNRNGYRLTVDATATSFKNVAVSTMSNSELFSVTDRIIDAIDSSLLDGLVSLRADEVFVTDIRDNFPTGAIQRAVNLAEADDTVNVGAGNYGEKVVVDKKVALLLDTGGVNTTSLETTAGTEISLGGLLTVDEGATLRDSVKLIADLFIDSGAEVTSLSSVNGTHTLDLTGVVNLSGSYETAAFIVHGDTVLRSDTVIDTSQANGAIQLLGAVDGVESTEQNLTLNAGTGKVTSVDIGQSVRVGEVTVNSGDFDAAAGTTNVDSLTVNGADVKLGNSTVNALNGVNIKAAHITGSINANDITLEATDSVDTIVTAQTVSVQSSDIQGEFTATEATLVATDSVDTIVTAQKVSVKSNDIQGEFNATEATLVAKNSIQITADIDELDVSANTASIDGDVDNIQVLSGGNKFLTLNNAGFLQIPDSLGNEQSFLVPELSGRIDVKELPKEFPDYSDISVGFELSLNIVGIDPASSRATADFGNQVLKTMTLLQSDSGDLKGDAE